MHKSGTSPLRKSRNKSAPVRRQSLSKQADITLRAHDMVSGLVVAGFGKVRQSANTDRLDQLVFAHAACDFSLQGVILVLQ